MQAYILFFKTCHLLFIKDYIMYILKFKLFAQHIVLPNKCNNNVCKWCQEAAQWSESSIVSDSSQSPSENFHFSFW